MLTDRRTFLAAGTAAVAALTTTRFFTQQHAADGSTDDRMPLAAALARGAGKVILLPGRYIVSAGAVNPNPRVSDPEPSALIISASGTIIDGEGTGEIEVDTADKTIFHVKNPSERSRPVGGAIRNFRRLTQPYGSPQASGLNDDYAVIRMEAARDWVIENIHVDRCEIAFSDHCAQTVAYTDRTARRNIVNGFTIAKCGYMGFQLFGCYDGSYTGLSAHGEDSDGSSRAGAHGLRLVGFDFALCQGNEASGVFERFANGLSIQNHAMHNRVEVRALDCQNGASIVRSADAASAAKHNTVRLITVGGDYGLFDDGGSYNSYEVDILNPGIRGINATRGGAIRGLATGNLYRGRIRKTTTGSTTRLAQLDGPDTRIDLDLEGNGTTSRDTAFGLVSTGRNLTGAVRARNCRIGVQLGGAGGRVSVRTTSCGTDLVIARTARNLVVDCDCSGNVVVSSGATNIALTGRVAGRVTDSGTGTDLSNLNP
jgi:hypothetical protein